jgi:hypothetical protein
MSVQINGQDPSLLPITVTYTGTPVQPFVVNVIQPIGVQIDDTIYTASGKWIEKWDYIGEGCITITFTDVVGIKNSFSPDMTTTVTEYNISSVAIIGEDLLCAEDSGLNNLTSLIATGLTIIGKKLQLSAMPSLTEFLLPSIEHIGSDITLSAGTDGMTTFTLGTGILSVGGDVTITSPTLTEASVDGVLKSLAMLGSERLVVTLTGTNGTATIAGIGAGTETVTWNTSLAQSAIDFVLENRFGYFAAEGVNIESDGADIIFTNSSFCYGSIEFTGTPANGDTVTIDGKVYTFRTTLTPTEGEVLINGLNGSGANISAAIDHTGTPGTDYSCAAAHPTMEGFLTVEEAEVSFSRTIAAKAAGVTGIEISYSCPVSEAIYAGISADGASPAPFVIPTITPATEDLDGTVTNESTSTIYAGHTVDVSGNCAVPSATGLAWKTVLESAGRGNTVTVSV